MGLDSLIIKQFEKINQKVHQKWGWNKYDLSRTASTCSFSAIMLFGGDQYLSGAVEGDGAKMVGGALVFVMNYLWFSNRRENDHLLERLEHRKALYGEKVNHLSNYLRIPLLGAGIFLFYQCCKTLGHEYSDMPKAFLAAGVGITSYMISDYCRELSFTPSRKNNPNQTSK